jgi:hypothetical protein
MKRDRKICTECGGEFHEDHEWKRNSDDGLVCENCAFELPEFGIGKRPDAPRFYGYASKKVGDSSQSVDGCWVGSREEARAEILGMCQKLWGDVTIIEEGD